MIKLIVAALSAMLLVSSAHANDGIFDLTVSRTEAIDISNISQILSHNEDMVLFSDAAIMEEGTGTSINLKSQWAALTLKSARLRKASATFFSKGENLGAVILSDGLLRFELDNDKKFLPSLKLPIGYTSAHLSRQHNGKVLSWYVIASGAEGEKKALVWSYDETTEAWTSKQSHYSKSTGIFHSIAPINQSYLLGVTNKGQLALYNTITNEWSVEELNAVNLEQFEVFAVSSEAKNQFTLAALDSDTKTLTYYGGSIKDRSLEFGSINMMVLVVYLLTVLGVGLFFTFKNKNTEDYFLGGKSIPWWAAACSIYATMLSSLTYVALPAIVYQTNWVLLLGIWMIAVVAPLGIYVAMPFFRQLNIYSAYEYLSYRFNFFVRTLASGLFALFHVGRMGIVMALTALALSAVTPLSSAECVLIMGVFCLLYCTLGGIEAVIWTDTIQTIVLLMGAVLCFGVIIANIEGGLSTYISVGMADEKFTMANMSFSLSGITELTIWVIVLGGIGQNISSYVADQAVVQRYLVTPDQKSAAKSIWANAIIGIPGSLLFCLIGSGLYVFYKTQPEKLNPTIQIDQVFPSFISTELPIGIAGLIIAGVFAAAQSTVSTSMNSVATTVLTNIVKPLGILGNEKSEMRWARLITFIVGVMGTLVGLIFIDPAIRSLMEEYFKVIGMFMGALGGLFILGAISTRANGAGALMGLVAGVGVMLSAWQTGWANGYMYATLGILTCVVVGYIASFFFSSDKDLYKLTIHTAHISHKR